LPPLEDIRDAWLQAVQQEDATAAGWCARLCEGLRGAEAFADTDGLDAFVTVAMGQSMKTNTGGLMVALAQALMADMTEFKVAIFETLAAASFWPSLRGRIAGSGVLGVIGATLLAPRHPPAVKALMTRLCGQLTVDASETVRLGDPKRAEEFVKLRGQLISSGAIKAIVEMVGPGGTSVEAAAATGAIAAFVGAGSDAAMRGVLAEAQVVPKLVARISGARAPEGGRAGAEAPQASADSAGTDAGGAVDSDRGGDVSEGARDVAGGASGAGGSDADSSDEAGAEDPALSAILGTVRAIIVAEGDGMEAVLAPLGEASLVERLRAFLGSSDGGASGAARDVVEQALRCLAALGGRRGAWPPVDEGLAADLERLLFFGSDAAADLLAALLADRGRAAQLGDLRRLRRVVQDCCKPKDGASGSAAAAAAKRALDATRSCDHCGKSSDKALLACTGCHKREFCSRECQKVDWKSHKPACTKAR